MAIPPHVKDFFLGTFFALGVTPEFVEPGEVLAFVKFPVFLVTSLAASSFRGISPTSWCSGGNSGAVVKSIGVSSSAHVPNSPSLYLYSTIVDLSRSLITKDL
jgi:hypothetical protein